MKLNYRKWLLILFLSINTAVFAYTFRHYKVENGLSENSVFCSLQDSKGFMWFGTKDGLNRFDGRRFLTFHTQPNDTNSIGNSFIHSLHEDKSQNLWVGTERGIYIYNPKLNRFNYFDIKTNNGQYLDQSIYDLCEDKVGNLWIATSYGLYKYNFKSKILTDYFHDDNNPKSIFSNIVNTILCDSKGTVWIGTIDSGLNRYNPNSNDFTTFSFIPAAGTFKTSVLKIIEDSQGNLVLGTITEGLIFFDPISCKYEECQLGIPAAQIYYSRDVFEYSTGVYMVATESGLQIYERATGKITQIKASTVTPNSLSDNAVYSFCKDKEGGIWIGTYFGGVNYLSPKPEAFELFTPLDNVNSISGKAVSQFCEDKSGNLWIATEDGGLNYFNTTNKTFKSYNHDPSKNSISYSNVHCLQFDGDNLWIGTFAKGLNVLNTKTGKFSFYNASPDIHSIYDNNVFSIYKDLTGTIWIGSIGGLCKYNRENNNFDRVEEPLARAFIYDILQDINGEIWFATYGQGLLRYNPQTRQWKSYRNNPENSGSIPHNKIISICQDDKKRLWFGSEGGGFFTYMPENDSFITYDVTSGLPNNVVYMVVPDRDYLWLTTNKGLVRFNPETKSVKLFTKTDGLQGDQFNFKSAYKTQNGKIYFGGVNGFNILTPELLVDNNYVPPVLLTNFQLFNKDVQITESETPLKQSISFTDKITLDYNQTVLNFEFNALSYCAPDKNQFAYKLEGFDKDWIYSGNNNKITYTNLPTGKYNLKIKASNNDGVWNNDGISLKIYVQPPFWASSWAYILYIIVLVGGSFQILNVLRKRRLKEEQIGLERLQAEKEIELYNAKIDFFTNIAHEIRTPLSLIKAPLDNVLKKNTDSKLSEYLKVMERNTNRLMTLVNQLLDFRKAEKNSYTVNFKHANLHELLQSIYDSFKFSTENRGIGFELVLPSEPLIVNADVECITKITSNLVSNAIKHAKDKVIITLIAGETNKDNYEIRVYDDGEGIHASENDKIFQAFYQIRKDKKQNQGTGIGLALVKLLVEIHGGRINYESVENEYTLFIVNLPSYKNIKSDTDALSEISDEIILPVIEHKNINQTVSLQNDELPSLMVVEDNEDLNLFLVNYFQENYSVMSAFNGKQAVKVLENFAPDIIISDIMMPEMDGLELCNYVKINTLYSHIPVVLLTAKTDTKFKIEGLENGADAYMEKPFSVEHLEAQVINLLENREKLKQGFTNSPLTSIKSIGKNKADEEFLIQITEIIEENITNFDFSVDDLSGQIAMSRSNFYRKIKGFSGLTPNDFIRLVRLKKAVKLMSEGETRINEICYMVGFNSSSYFAKCFKTQFGMLPKEFIKNL